MKILDRYIAKNFMIGYVISFCVLIGLRIIIDLFVNLDEFAENADLGTVAVLYNIVAFYATNTTLYFRDVSGMITVVAAAFSLGRMVRANELVAIIASGVSAKRLVGPILVLSLFFTGLSVANQELLIPSISDKLVRTHEAVPGQESYVVWFIIDGNGSLICSRRFDVQDATFVEPTIITRRLSARPGVWETTGQISADRMTYNYATGKWDLLAGRKIDVGSTSLPRPFATYDAGDLTPKNVPVRLKAEHQSLMSSWQLAALAGQETKTKDIHQLLSQKHFRVTDPLINLTMLMISLPFLVCRDPKAMKSAVLISFALTSLCFVTAFVCKLLAAEVFFNWFVPGFWAWLPVFIFVPVAVMALDSMKT